MKPFQLILLFFAFTTCSCQQKAGTAEEPESAVQDSASNEPFYPISQYIQEQIAYVDSMPLAIEQHTYVNSQRTDSAIIDRPAFARLASDFAEPDLNDPRWKSGYTETKFHDQTINTLTFSYNTKEPAAELQQRDILLDPETQAVRNVMFRKIQHRGDTTITINGLWKPRMNFQISYIIEPKSGPMQTRQVKVIWDRPISSN